MEEKYPTLLSNATIQNTIISQNFKKIRIEKKKHPRVHPKTQRITDRVFFFRKTFLNTFYTTSNRWILRWYFKSFQKANTRFLSL